MGRLNEPTRADRPFLFFLTFALLASFAEDQGFLGKGDSGRLLNLGFVALGVLALRLNEIIGGLRSLSRQGAVLLTCYVAALLALQAVHLGDKPLHVMAFRTLIFGAYLLQVGRWAGIFAALKVLASLVVILQVAAVYLDDFGVAGIWVAGRFRGTFYHPNVAGAAFGVLAVPILVDLVEHRRAKDALIVGALFLATAATQSRTAIGAFVIAAAIVALRGWRRPWRVPSAAVAAVLGTAAVCIPFLESISDYLRRGQDLRDLSSLTGRTAIWMRALDDISRNFWTGTGLTTDAFRIWWQAGRSYWTTPSEHNYALFLFRRFGAVYAMTLLLGIFVAALALLRRGLSGQGTHASRARAWTAFAILGVLMTVGVSESVVDEIPRLTGSSLVLALLVAAVRDRPADSPGSSTS